MGTPALDQPRVIRAEYAQHIMEEQSLIRSAAQLCIDQGGGSRRKAKPERRLNLKPIRSDAVLANLCRRCGLRGQHPDAEQCIEALRDRLSRWE